MKLDIRPASTVRPGDMVPLAERMGHLQALRVSFAFVVTAASAGLVPGSASATDLGRITIAYLALTACVEVLRRIGGKRRLAMVATMLLIDAVYLAAAVQMTGTTESPLVVLAYVHLIAVTLLASYRTGIKLALWHSLLLLIAFSAERSTEGGIELGLGNASPMLNVAVFWLVSIGTAVYSSLNERELRRNRAHLETLAEMARELESNREPAAVAAILLSKVMEGFGFARGVVIGAHEDGAVVLAETGAQNLEVPPGVDSVILRVWEQKEISLIKTFNSEEDPRLYAILPSARNVLIAPMFAAGRPIGALVLETPQKTTYYEARVVSMIGQLASHAALALRNAWLLQQLRTMAETDPLTEVANRRTFKKVLEREISRASRRSEQMALVMLDLDHFKDYNDKHGHQPGDDLLRATGRVLKEVSREYDTVARYGGEEFAVILPACTPMKAQELAERLRRSLRRIPALTPVTASAGVAVFPLHGRDPEELIRAADGALYESKRRGRDRATLARAGSGALAFTAP